MSESEELVVNIAEFRGAVVAELLTLNIHPSIISAYAGESDDAVRQDIEHSENPGRIARLYAGVLE